MKLPNKCGHLTYCTNIHAGETWTDIYTQLRHYLPKIKKRVSPYASFGVGLRLSARAAQTLSDQDSALSEFRAWLERESCYVFTLNGFPYGDFHRGRVKEKVYLPDWSSKCRLIYTNNLADLLVRLLPDDLPGSISTVPGAYHISGQRTLLSIIEHILAHVAYLYRLEQGTGKLVQLALEPEPGCMLETIDETVTFFKKHLYSCKATSRLSVLTGLSTLRSEEALHRYLGVCYDACHAAIEFESPQASVTHLQQAGIPIAKLQLSSALRIPCVDQMTGQWLEGFNEPVYLHQTVTRGHAGYKYYTDLPDALASIEQSQGEEWRIHFHVPIFLDTLEYFRTTQSFLGDILAIQRSTPFTEHLEVETYTWDVLPECYRGGDLDTSISRELVWAHSRLT